MRWWLLSLVIGVGSGSAALALDPEKPARAPAPRAPAIPDQIGETERLGLRKAADHLSRGEFAPASGLLKTLLPPAAPAVFVDWTAVIPSRRAGYREAVQRAVGAWNEGLGGEIRFRLTEVESEAHLFILFQREVASHRGSQVQLACSDLVSSEEPGSLRANQLRIALRVPYTEIPHTSASVAHLVGQGLGSFLGLLPTQAPEDLMGPDTHLDTLAQRPSASELERVRELRRVWRQFREYAEQKVAVHVPLPKLVVDGPELDVGEVWRGDTGRCTFTIRNAGDAPLEISAKPNCGCIVPKYDRVIPAGGSGKIEAEIQTTDLQGHVLKAIEIRSNDPAQPLANVFLRATIRSLIEVRPSSSPVIALKSDGETVQQLEVRIAGPNPIKITRVACNVPYAEATAEPMESPNGATAAYRVTLRVQPMAPYGRSPLGLTAFTDSQREPRVQINATCEKGILVVPGTVHIGTLRPDTPLPVTQVATLARREGRFNIRSVQSDDPKLEVSRETVTAGTQYRLTLTYRGGWSPGAVRRTISVETDDPHQTKLEIPVLATLLAAEGTRS